MSDKPKISFSFGNAVKTAVPAAPLSNLELLMAKAKSQPAKPKLSAVFASDDEEDGVRPPSSVAGPSKPRATAPKKTGVLLSRSERKAQETALALDANVFDYDGVYDNMKAATAAVTAEKKKESEDRKPKYIEGFLAAAQTRRLDKIRAEDAMIARERAAEGDELKDGERFVTEAYKKQREEVRLAEEEERLREGKSLSWLDTDLPERLRKTKTGPGMTAFYKNMLDDTESEHAAAMAAAAKSEAKSLAVKPPSRDDDYEPEAEFDPYLQREAATSSVNSSTGKRVETNDEGEVVDNRTLLKAGLNIMKKPSAPLAAAKAGAATVNLPYQSRAVGASAGYKERMERERARLAEQVKAEAERVRLEK
jgi:coiled-coil domain-containing protein 55